MRRAVYAACRRVPRLRPRWLSTGERTGGGGLDDSSIIVRDGDAPYLDPKKQKTAVVAILGTPNAGKSVMLNYIAETKVSAESPKRHTTRREIRAVLTEGDTQLVIVDTPGIVSEAEQRDYEATLTRSPWDALTGADAALIVIDAAKRLYEAEHQMINRLAKQQQEREWFPPLYLALNKVDLVHPKHKLLNLSEHINEKLECEMTHYTCGVGGDGMRDLICDLQAEAKPRPWLFPAEVRSDLTFAERVEEVIRERIFVRFHEEIPYEVDQKVEEATQHDDGTVVIRHSVYVNTPGQKRIIRGKSGLKLKALEQDASLELTNVIGRPVTTVITVSVKPQR